MKPSFPYKAVLLYGAVLLVLSGALPARAADGKTVVRALETALRAKIKSPNGTLKISVKPSARAGEGYFSEIKISARPAQIKKFRFSELALTARDVRIDVNKLLRNQEIITLQTKTQLRAKVSEADLTRVLAQGKSTAPLSLKVKFLKDRIRIAGNWNWTWFRGPVVGVGKLRVASSQLYFDLISLRLNNREVPSALRDKVDARLNPILDYRDLPFQPRFRAVKFNGSSATIMAY